MLQLCNIHSHINLFDLRGLQSAWTDTWRLIFFLIFQSDRSVHIYMTLELNFNKSDHRIPVVDAEHINDRSIRNILERIKKTQFLPSILLCTYY